MRGYYRKLKTAIRRFGLESSILFTGPLSEQEMRWCYQHCKMFLMTSRVEACPNIALETMAQGCIAIVAHNPPLPEMLDNTVFFYPPKEHNALAGRIERVLNMSEEQLNAMRRCSLERATQFSQDKCAKLTVAELIKAAGCTPQADRLTYKYESKEPELDKSYSKSVCRSKATCMREGRKLSGRILNMQTPTIRTPFEHIRINRMI